MSCRGNNRRTEGGQVWVGDLRGKRRDAVGSVGNGGLDCNCSCFEYNSFRSKTRGSGQRLKSVAR